MNRWPWIVFSVVVLGFLGASFLAFRRYSTWKEKGREEAVANYSALAVCLVGGPERISAGDVSEYASRLHESADDPTLATCARLRDKFVNSSYARRELGDLSRIANEIILGPFTNRPSWHLEPFFFVSAELPWNPPTHIDGKPIPKPMVVAINSQLDARTYTPQTFSPKTFDVWLDPDPPNHVTVATDDQNDVVIADAPGKPLSQPTRIERSKRHSEEPDWPKEAKDSPGIYLENTFFWVETDRLFMRRPEEKKATVIKLPGTTHSRIQSCRAPNRRVIGVQMTESKQVVLFAFRNQALEPAGIAEIRRPQSRPSKGPGFTSSWTMSCDDETIRITWAVAEPSGPNEIDAQGNRAPPPGGFQNIYVETCTQGQCTRKETQIELNVGLAGSGGFSAQVWTMMAPDAYSVGNYILVMWQEEFAYRYRFAPIDELKNARNEFLAQLDGAPGINDAAHTIPSSQVRTLTRGNVALTSLIIEENGRRYLIVVRFDADGNVLALPVVEKR